MKKIKHDRWPSCTTTDQEYCYNKDGQVILCTGTGQDASFPKTQEWATASRFSIKDQVTKDRFTQAIWSRDANPFGFPQTWHEALETVATMREQRIHGYADWQLPSRDLLFSLISHQHVNPAVAATHSFENIFNGYYWTRDSCCRLSDQAWYIHMGGGRIHKGMKHGSYLVWPVCPGPDQTRDGAWGERLNPFAVDADSVYDKRTGLTWLVDANPIGRPLSWEAALAVIRTFNNDHVGVKPG